MPLVPEEHALGFTENPMLPGEAQRLGKLEAANVTPGFREVLGSEMQTDTSWASIGASEGGMVSKFALQAYDPDFDLGAALKGTPFENSPDMFVTARNADHVKAIMADVEREEKNRDILERSTWGQYIPALVIGQVADPINWMSLGTVGALKFAGKRALTGMARTAVIGTGVAVDTAIQETALQASQQTRTLEQSLVSIGGSAALGSLIGWAGAKLLLPEERAIIEKQMETELEPVFRPVGTSRASSVGAAAVDVAERQAAPERVGAFGLEKISANMGPLQRTTQSSLEGTRRVVNELASDPYLYKGNEAGEIVAPRGDALGRPGAVENRIKSVWASEFMPSFQAMKDEFLAYRGVHANEWAKRAKMGLNDRLGRNGEALSEIEFRQAVTDALNNGGVHPIPQVSAVAKKIQAEILERITKEGQAAGLVKEGENVGMPRAYQFPKINAERLRFRSILTKWLEGRNAEIDAKLRAGEITGEQAMAKARIRADMVPAEVEELADRMIERIGRVGEGRISMTRDLLRDADDAINEKMLLDADDFAIPYNMVSDFVERDAEILMRMMLRSQVPDIEIALRFGDPEMKGAKDEIIREATDRINAAATAKERAAIQKQLDRDLKDIDGMRDRIAGRYGLPTDPTSVAVRAGRFLRDAATVTKMGASPLASIPEASRLITARGLGALFSETFFPMMKNWGHYIDTAKEARQMTHAMEHWTEARALAFAESAEDWGSTPKIDKFSRESTKTFMRMTGLGMLTDWQKSGVGVATMRTILEAAENIQAGKASTRDIRDLARLGISKENAAVIADQFKKHGQKTDNIWAAETGKWDPEARAAREAFMTGMQREVDRLITTPGQEVPLVASTELGRLLLQFKTFGIGAYERVLISGLQHNDARFWTSAIGAIAVAMMVNEARVKLFGSPDGKKPKSFAERWADPRERNQIWINAVDKAGVLGWTGDINSTMDRVFGGGLGSTFGRIERKPGLGTPSDMIKQFAGPGINTGGDLVFAGTKAALTMTGNHRWSEADTRQMERVIPYIGLSYIRAGLEALGAEQAVNKALNARKPGQ